MLLCSHSLVEFLSVPELAMNPLSARVIAQFDSKKDDQVNFKQFLQTLSVFSPRGGRAAKLKGTCMRPSFADLTL